jgi:hypothetical protein
MEQLATEASFQSRNQVLASLCDLASYLSYDEDTITRFGGKVIGLFISQLKKTVMASKNFEQQEYNAVIGLLNMLSYPSFEEEVYFGLKEVNFEYFMQKTVRYLLQGSEVTVNYELVKTLFIMLRCYLEYQARNAPKLLSPDFHRVLGKFIPHAIRHNLFFNC